MREYSSSEIRNVAVVGHGASGKTSLVDALAFVSGASKRHGSVKEGTALTDYSPEELDRKYSINLGIAYAEWMDTKVNLIDTPGYLDFQGDAVSGLAAADGALCVVSATAGVEVGTEKMFREAVDRGDPALFVVTMLDKEHASFERTYEHIKTRLTSKVIPVRSRSARDPSSGAWSTSSRRRRTSTRPARRAPSTRRWTFPPRSGNGSITTTRS